MVIKAVDPLGRQSHTDGAAAELLKPLELRTQRFRHLRLGIHPSLLDAQQRPADARSIPGQQHPAHSSQQRRIAGEPAHRIEAWRQQARTRQADGAETRANAEYAAIAGRNAHRPTGVRSQGEIDQPGCHRRRRAAARPAREAVRSARVARGAVPDVLSNQAVGQLHRFGLADQPRTRL
jgi:hypothetical protein